MTRASEKRDRFVRLAEKRVANAIKAIRLVGNLSNRSHYDYSQKDVRLILSALNQEVESVKERFRKPSRSHSVEFKLKR